MLDARKETLAIVFYYLIIALVLFEGLNIIFASILVISRVFYELLINKMMRNKDEHIKYLETYVKILEDMEC